MPFLPPWLIAAAQACLSALFGIDGPLWFNERWLAIGRTSSPLSGNGSLGTVIVIGRPVPRDICGAAAVDGATGLRCFVHVSFRCRQISI